MEKQVPTPDVPQPENEKSFFGIIVHSFFVIPFLIAVFCVLLFAAVSLLTREQQTVYDLLEDVKTGGSTKRWQAAFELSKLLANPQLIPQGERFANELIYTFERSQHDQSLVRQYLALAMGRTGKSEFYKPLTANIETEKEENLYAIIYALGMLKDKRASAILTPYLNHPNSRIRSLTVVTLGNIGDPSSKDFLKKALKDSEPNVEWGSAISLAKLQDASGAKMIGQLLNRKYLEQFAEVDAQEQLHLMLAAIDAAAELNEPKLTEIIQDLAHTDKNMKIRRAAMEYLRMKEIK